MARTETMTVAEFWDQLGDQTRRELIQEVLCRLCIPEETLRSVAGRQWHRIPERMIVHGIYIKDALRPLLEVGAS